MSSSENERKLKQALWWLLEDMGQVGHTVLPKTRQFAMEVLLDCSTGEELNNLPAPFMRVRLTKRRQR